MKNVESFVAALAERFSGEVDASLRRRAEYATDASNYRILPVAVAFPRSDEDVRVALDLAREYGIPFTSRGGGTSCAGNSIGPGLVLDFSRHMNRILEIDPEGRTALVEVGVVMSELQAATAEYGLRFGPDPSTQNRATVGGMVGNNACGPHALAWGRTADNVLGLAGFLAGGEPMVVGDMPGGTAAPSYKSFDDFPELAELLDSNLAVIRKNLGRFKRQVSGYSLEHLLPEAGRNLPAFFTGTEGTLAVFTRVRVSLVPLPTTPTLLVLGYPDMPAAAEDVPSLISHHPLAVEGIDARLVDVVRRAKGSVPELPEGGGWLFIEAESEEQARALAEASTSENVRICPPGPEATALWRIRADGAGLGGRTPADHPAWPGWEDSAVPPEHLGNYLRELEALLAKHHLDGLIYGHFGDGCVHVRIDFPIEEEEGHAVMRAFMEDAADLAASYGGSLSGEHGDGRARSELLPRMYPSEVIELFESVKAIFDPYNLLNPGVLIRPDKLDEHLRRPAARTLTYAGGFHFHEDDGNLTRAVHRCTGVGNCRADRFDAGFFMCPSYHATRDEKDVTRGRARILQELTRGEAIKDFDAPEVLESLDLCLACKACRADCPTGVDIARLRSEVLFRAYRGKLRPRTHYLLGRLPALAGLIASMPGMARLANAVMSLGPVRTVAFTLAGMDRRRTMPHFAETSYSSESEIRSLRARTRELGRHARARGFAPDALPKRPVVLWADSFSQSLDTRGALAMAEVLQRAGYTVLIPEGKECCGLTAITTGQLTRAKAALRGLLGQLAPYAASGIPIVGVEPSCTAVLRDDALDLLPEDNRSELVSGMTFTLAELLTHPQYGPASLDFLPSLEGMSIVAQPHCHHHAVMGWKADEALLRSLGANVKVLSGCCGLAGNFGMEAGHYETSVAVAESHLLPALREAEEGAVFLADGFSCRTQADQLAGELGVHLAQLLRDGKRVQARISH